MMKFYKKYIPFTPFQLLVVIGGLYGYYVFFTQ